MNETKKQRRLVSVIELPADGYVGVNSCGTIFTNVIRVVNLFYDDGFSMLAAVTGYTYEDDGTINDISEVAARRVDNLRADETAKDIFSIHFSAYQFIEDEELTDTIHTEITQLRVIAERAGLKFNHIDYFKKVKEEFLRILDREGIAYIP